MIKRLLRSPVLTPSAAATATGEWRRITFLFIMVNGRRFSQLWF